MAFQRNNKGWKIAGVTISITWLGFLVMVLWGKAVSIKFDDFFVQYVDLIFWGASIILLILIILGGVSLRALISGARGSTIG